MRALTALISVLILLGLAGCGEGDDDVEPTPEEITARLQGDGYTVGEVVTDGANIAVARGGKLDAEAYLPVDRDPQGNIIYAGVYFFETEEDAAVLARERERNEDRDFFSDQIGTRVYEIAGTNDDLIAVEASAEAE